MIWEQLFTNVLLFVIVIILAKIFYEVRKP